MPGKPANLWTLGFDLSRLTVETLNASARVIDARSRVIYEACRDPLSADHAELNRMVGEKMLAFSAAGWSMAGDAAALQRDWWKLMSVSARGPLGCSRRATRLAKRATGSAKKALTPVTRTATANVRRLGGKGAKGAKAADGPPAGFYCSRRSMIS
jgi:hypothetical protein